ncbi:hypothetical protein J1614_009487 [Plenodomus biglobosus]|nr:hypothetical protein J1614_009487 [Plenodomus biglobosus]
MKLSKFILFAVQLAVGHSRALLPLKADQQTPTTAIAATASPTPYDLPETKSLMLVQEDEDVALEKRVIDWSEIRLSNACQACVAAQCATLGINFIFRRGLVPTSLYLAFSLAVSNCGNACSNMLTAVVPEGYEKTWSELTWVAYIAGWEEKKQN